MRQYKTVAKNQEEMISIICNQCGKEIVARNSIIEEGVASAVFEWGYFSHKDGEKHQVDLCEECYDKWIKGFKVSI